MKRILLCCLLILLSASLIHAANRIILKDGSVVEGIIIGSSGAKLRIQKNDGSVLEIDSAQIKKIEEIESDTPFQNNHTNEPSDNSTESTTTTTIRQAYDATHGHQFSLALLIEPELYSEFTGASTLGSFSFSIITDLHYHLHEHLGFLFEIGVGQSTLPTGEDDIKQSFTTLFGVGTYLPFYLSEENWINLVISQRIRINIGNANAPTVFMWAHRFGLEFSQRISSDLLFVTSFYQNIYHFSNVVNSPDNTMVLESCIAIGVAFGPEMDERRIRMPKTKKEDSINQFLISTSASLGSSLALGTSFALQYQFLNNFRTQVEVDIIQDQVDFSSWKGILGLGFDYHFNPFRDLDLAIGTDLRVNFAELSPLFTVVDDVMLPELYFYGNIGIYSWFNKVTAIFIQLSMPIVPISANDFVQESYLKLGLLAGI